MASICDVNGKKPKIEYPNFWQYKVILETTKYERAHIEELLKGEEYKISFSNFSNGGKFSSFNVAVLVDSDEKRVEIFDKLIANFKFVL
ncbi:MAG: DUF493 family protein [Campylobacter sp.]|nr:DUF493 family protein [Campylobacter sp.]